MRPTTIRARLASIAVAVAITAGPSAALADQNIGSTRVPLLRVGLASSSHAMEEAFRSLPNSCRKAVQRQLVMDGFAKMRIDGVWSTKVAEGMVRYTSEYAPMAHGMRSIAGAKGLYWHIAFEEQSCPRPPYT